MANPPAAARYGKQPAAAEARTPGSQDARKREARNRITRI